MPHPFFHPTLDPIKPYALMDLDDTLFQTQRKIDAWHMPTSATEQLVCATVNKDSEPLGFMTQRQSAFFSWLLSCTEVIVVTARDRHEMQRVKLPVDGWQVLTHGAIILNQTGKPDRQWQQHMHRQLVPLQDKLNQLSQLFTSHSNNPDSQLIFTPHMDSFCHGSTHEDLTIYLAIKHAQKNHQALADLAAKLPTLIHNFEQDFYVHVNANNLAILPQVVHKRHAAHYLLTHHLDKQRPSFGFGDSLADLPFLRLLDWYGVPNHGQLHDALRAL